MSPARPEEGSPSAPGLPDVRVFSGPGDLQGAAADLFAEGAAEALGARGRFMVGLSGGTTPRGLYALLATEAFRSRVPWADVHVFWSDERHVPPAHPDSNYRMAKETLLGHVPVPPGNVHRIRAEDPDATAAAAAYERELRDSFGLSPGAKPRFDLILLGMGADGHTGSLFPGGRAVEERERLVVAECVEALEAWRITLTLPVLNAARRVVFLVTGEEKAATLAAVLSPRTGRDHPPAARVRPAQGSLVWLVDAAAARLLESTKITDSSGRQPGETRIEEARM